MQIDLHAHTTASDGLLSPSDVVDRARDHGVSVLAICDHDSVAGIPEARERAAEVGLELVPGIEVSTEIADCSVHMLGYFIDPDAPALAEYESRTNASRKVRVERIIERLREAGLAIRRDDVFRQNGHAVPGRPHVARALISRGHAESMGEAFRRWLSSGSPGYVGCEKIAHDEAARLIRETGGVPVVAHPGLDGLHPHLDDLVEGGVQGVEVYHPDHTDEMRERFRTYAREHDLVITGGSDFHGDGREGSDLGQNDVPVECLEALRRLAGREVSS